MTKTKLPSPAIDGLFDIYGQQHAIEVIRDWASVPDNRYTESDAKTIEDLVVDPLWEWIGQQGDNAKNRLDVKAAAELAEYAENDIVYGFRYRQKVYPEYVDKLDALWRELQRIVGAGTILGDRIKQEKASERQSINASQPRKKEVTKDALDKFKDEFDAKHGGTRGWKKSACIEFGIDLKTLNDRLNQGVSTAIPDLL
jgi:hypothetical protein